MGAAEFLSWQSSAGGSVRGLAPEAGAASRMETMEPRPPLALRILRFPLTRLILSILVMALLMFLASRILPLHGPRGVIPSAWMMVPMEAVPAVAALIAMLGVGIWVERAPLAGLGFGPRAVPQTGAGFLAGAALLTGVVGVLALCGWYRLGGAASPGGGHSLASEFAGAVVLFLLVGIFEEVFFRGIMFRLLEQLLGTWAALLLTAAQFGWVHHRNPGANWVSTVGIALEAGVLLAAAFVVTKNLWAPIGMHWAWNLFEGPVFGTPVSGMNLPHLINPRIAGPTLWTGGGFGPEAGLVCMIAGGGFGLVLMAIAVRRGMIFTPPWLRRLLRMSPPATPLVQPPSQPA